MKRFLVLIASLVVIIGCGVSAPTTTPLPTQPTKFVLAASPQPTAKPVLCSIVATVLNLRKGPGTEHIILARLDNGAELEVISNDGNWYKVTSPSGEVGYVHSSYCK